MLDRAKLEAQLTQLPLYQYAFLKPEELPFSTRLQTVCRENCPMYGKSWSCPPAVGTVDACRARCLAYPEALLVVTVQDGIFPSVLIEVIIILVPGSFFRPQIL